jgi:hypothetical protein
MEFFIPSVLVLLLAAAVVFFILPRFGPSVLAVVSVVLLAYGVYQHMNSFGTEYRLSTWQLGVMSYAPYIMMGGLLLVIAFYLISISPFGKAGNTTAPSMPEVPTVAEMPPANTATNMLTAGVNNALKGATAAVGNVAAAVGMKNNGKAKGNGLANEAVNKVAEAANNVANGLGNTMKNIGNMFKSNNSSNKNNSNNKGLKIPGLNFPGSQI